MNKLFCVYILTNRRHTVFYTGVSSDLKGRICQHREKLVPGFTARYAVNKLVFYEVSEDALNAIAREKQIKAGSRNDKINLITQMNPEWRDLYRDLRCQPDRDCRVGATRLLAMTALLRRPLA